MYLPSDPDERLKCIRTVLDRITASQPERVSRYRSLRSWYLYGSDAGRARYNKLYPHIGTLASFLYAQESARFTVSLSPSADDDSLSKSDAIADYLRDKWSDCGADTKVASQVRWSLVYGCALLKLVWQDGRLHAFPMDPGCFCVYDESTGSLERQEAVLHTYQLERNAVQRLLVAKGYSPESADEVLTRLGSVISGDVEEGSSNAGQLVIGQLNPILFSPPAPGSIAGGIADMGVGTGGIEYSPASDARVLDMQELWVWDDDIKDYRVITLINKQFVLYDRPNIFVPHELPFIPIVPDPLDDYFWGYSQVDALIPLQAWREKRMNQLDRLLQRQVNPPGVFAGFMGGVQDEKMAAVMRRGGVMANSQNPGAKVQLLTPELPPETFHEIIAIDGMFSETIGLSPLLEGKGQSGIGGEHALMLLQTGAGRIIRRALNIESALERCATLVLRSLQQNDPSILTADNGQRFTLGLFTHDYSVKISSHTSSPIFAGQLQADALRMMELGLIDGDSYLELTDPPMVRVLRQRLKQKEQAQQQQIQEMAQQVPNADKATFFESVLGKVRSAIGRKK